MYKLTSRTVCFGTVRREQRGTALTHFCWGKAFGWVSWGLPIFAYPFQGHWKHPYCSCTSSVETYKHLHSPIFHRQRAVLSLPTLIFMYWAFRPSLSLVPIIRTASFRKHRSGYTLMTATWITRNANIKPTVVFIFVQKCPDLLVFQLTGFTPTSRVI